MMDRKLVSKYLQARISSLVNVSIQAEDFANWYMELGPKRMVTIIKELMDEERAISQHEVGECERKMFEIKAARSELEKVVVE
jgi:hypothetical protein